MRRGCDAVYPLYPWSVATACSLSTTQFADVRPEGRFAPQALTGVAGGMATPKPRALTVIIRFAEDGSIADCAVRCTRLQRPIRMTYEEVEAVLQGRVGELAMSGDQSMMENGESAVKQDSSMNHESSMDQSMNRESPMTNTPSLPLPPIRNPSHSTAATHRRQHSPGNATILGLKEASSILPTTEDVFRRLEPWSSAEELERTLRQLQRLAHRRRRYREQRGCIDFSFAEARLHVADGHADGVIDSRRCAMEVGAVSCSEAGGRTRHGDDGGGRRSGRTAGKGQCRDAGNVPRRILRYRIACTPSTPFFRQTR